MFLKREIKQSSETIAREKWNTYERLTLFTTQPQTTHCKMFFVYNHKRTFNRWKSPLILFSLRAHPKHPIHPKIPPKCDFHQLKVFWWLYTKHENLNLGTFYNAFVVVWWKMLVFHMYVTFLLHWFHCIEFFFVVFWEYYELCNLGFIFLKITHLELHNKSTFLKSGINLWIM